MIVAVDWVIRNSISYSSWCWFFYGRVIVMCAYEVCVCVYVVLGECVCLNTVPVSSCACVILSSLVVTDLCVCV